jgi:hypothetical protein
MDFFILIGALNNIAECFDGILFFFLLFQVFEVSILILVATKKPARQFGAIQDKSDNSS